MPFWKVLFIMTFAAICLSLALGTIVVPFSMIEGNIKWLWFVGLLVGTGCMGALFAMFLANEDRKFTVGGPRTRR